MLVTMLTINPGLPSKLANSRKSSSCTLVVAKVLRTFS